MVPFMADGRGARGNGIRDLADRRGGAAARLSGLRLEKVLRSFFVLLACAVFLAVSGAARDLRAQAATVVQGGNVIYPGLDVNIADGGRLARLHIAFEAQCVDAASAQLAGGPAVREAIVLFLRDKTVAELSTLLGKRRLKQELVVVMNKVVGGPRVVRLYYLQFVIGS